MQVHEFRPRQVIRLDDVDGSRRDLENYIQGTQGVLSIWVEGGEVRVRRRVGKTGSVQLITYSPVGVTIAEEPAELAKTEPAPPVPRVTVHEAPATVAEMTGAEPVPRPVEPPRPQAPAWMSSGKRGKR